MAVPVLTSASGPSLGAGPFFAAVDLPSGKENTSVLVQNVGDANATIALDIYTPGGAIVNAASRVEANVPPGGTRNFPQALNDGLLPGFRGSGAVSSDQEIDALVVRDILNNLNEKSYSIANASVSGGQKLAIPIAFNELVTAQWNSRIAVVNTGGAVACIKVTYFLVPNVGGAANAPQTIVDEPTGQPGCANGYAIPVGGQVTFGRAGASITQFPASTQNNQMAVQIEVLNPGNNNIAANVDIYRSDGNRLLGSYEGLVVGDAAQEAAQDTGTNVVVPLAIKSQSGYYTVIGVLNVGGGAADVNINYIGINDLSDGIDGNGVGDPVNINVTLPAVSNVAFHSTYSAGTNVPIGFVGYAVVSSSAEIGAMVVRGKLTSSNPPGANEDLYTAARGVPTAEATNSANMPLIFRRFAPDGIYIGYNSWIQVLIADGSSAEVTIRMVGDPVFGAGCPAGPFEVTTTVSGSNVFYMNAATNNGFPAGNVPSCFFGGAQVTANKPVIVLSNVTADKFPGSDADGLYNAFPAD